MKITKGDVLRAELRYLNYLRFFGPHNQETLRAEIAWREIKERWDKRRKA